MKNPESRETWTHRKLKYPVEVSIVYNEDGIEKVSFIYPTGMSNRMSVAKFKVDFEPTQPKEEET